MKFIHRIARSVGKPLLYYWKNPRELVSPRSDLLSTTVDGIRLYCSYENHVERTVLLSGCFEPSSTALVRQYVRSGYCVFDVGANIGYYSLLLCKLVGPTGQVHCFEPTSYAVKRLQKNVALNPDLPTTNLIVNQAGLLATSVERVEAIESRFSARVPAYAEPESIRFLTLDEYCETHRVSRLDFIKIDVDGYDCDVVRGGIKTLARFRPTILAEFNDAVLVSHHSSVEEYIRLFVNLGYDLCLEVEDKPPNSLSSVLRDGALRGLSCNLLLFGGGH